MHFPCLSERYENCAVTHLIYKGKTENTHKYNEKYFTFVVHHSDCKYNTHTHTVDVECTYI